ncbi:MAG: zinc ABC transporter substrate-binding protein [Burkholderiales bacterium]
MLTLINKILRIVAAVIALTGALPASAALNIFACTPEWGALAKEIGGDKANVYIATNALQDPHRVEARPSLIARARSADLVVCTGAQLEIGWLPLVLTQAGNAKIQPGQPGNFEAARFVTMLEVPSTVDRSQGDVHPGGNPHLHLDPRNIAKAAVALSERMAQIDAGAADTYRARTKAFLERWQQAIARWEKEAAPLKGLPIVVYHKNMSYLIAWLGMREVGSLEPKPGLPPTASHLSGLLAQLQRDPAKAIVLAAYNDPRGGDWLADHAKIPVLILPFTVGGNDKCKDLFGLFDDSIAQLLAVKK